VVVDGTFGTPYHIRPLGYPGVTAVIHAATKYLGGHSDLTAGTVSSNEHGMLSKLATAQKLFGAPLPAFDSFLLARGERAVHARGVPACTPTTSTACPLAFGGFLGLSVGAGVGPGA
jgi:cystathionine beta-lyase/cystathionine gamma-synthase